MAKKLKIIFYILGASIIVMALVWKFVINKSVDDVSNTKANYTFTLDQLLTTFEKNDTAVLKKYNETIFEVEAPIKKISKDSTSITLELGNDASMSSLNCQMDKRHLEDLNSLSEGQLIKIKGKYTGYTIDEDFGLGTTIQMAYCIKIK